MKATGVADLAVPAIDPGLPAELLVRRPDLASAEAQLAAANADVAAARAALLPSIKLTGLGGPGERRAALAGLGRDDQRASAIAASLLQPIFDGGRLRGQKAIAESRERELVETYRKAILSGFEDVEQALAGDVAPRPAGALAGEVQTRARSRCGSRRCATAQGADDLLTVLDAQRTLFARRTSSRRSA